ncbi:MerR family transcriptional regulator [Ramlibacter sp. USB13]|uniref:MerR family transcriptional regulator n=1 Tax=Ramlibacter cellulosilyticus TaxID=2764187 RepID=A0A923SCX7_9BURK|nr:MerR family transcriptional regulator [Ramlibacter cellulosilyticus]MBC5781347.1 MerR family transcriptional regulator [Ramlibacter cellulosilyticus]
MLLQVGALARSTGLTVRTLHHYDEIGLLKPSARSESGYRMYDEADVARLHAIQALRHLGLPLAEIGPLLDGRGGSPERILEQQMLQLDAQIRQASELKERLALLRDHLAKGMAPAMEDWVRSLSLMTTYGRYFDAREIRDILQSYATIQEEWLALQAEVQDCMDAGAAHDSERAQALTRRWTALMVRWMDGDFERMDRWGAMYRAEPSAHGIRGAPPSGMIAYMEQAIAFRVGLLQAHFGEVDFKPARMVPDEEFAAIEKAGRKLLAQRTRPTSQPARALRERWVELLERMAGGDARKVGKLLTLHQADPLLLAGAPLGREVRDFLLQVPPPP